MHALSIVRRRPVLLVVAVIALLLAMLAPIAGQPLVQAQQQTVVVTSLADPSAAGQVTLRQAIGTVTPGGTITFAPGLLPGAINLTSELIINKDVTIQGPGAGLLTINGSNQLPGYFRAVQVTSGATVTISGVTIANSRANDGGAILNAGNLTITSSTIIGNEATNKGGGIHNQGILTVSGGAITGNKAFVGGAIHNTEGTVTLTNASLLGNNAFNGGGVYNENGTLSITGGTISDGTAVNGAGVFDDAGETTIDGTSLTNNEANEKGGAIVSLDGDVSISGSTLSGNTAQDSGSAIYTQDATTSVAGSTIRGNMTPEGTIYVLWGNLTISGTTIDDNAAFHGAGLYLQDGNVGIESSTISGNNATYGGAFWVAAGMLTTTNSTISGNDAEASGGGLHNTNGNITFAASTLHGNTSPIGSAITSHAGLIEVIASIIASEPSTANACNVLVDATLYSLASDASCFGGTDSTSEIHTFAALMLGPLQDNGGLNGTETHEPLFGSPARDRIPEATCLNDPGGFPTDQRGVPRPQNTNCDIGAVEYIDLDDVANPVLNLPAGITVTTTDPGGATVTFATSASDWAGNAVPIVCSSQSGATFPVGTTTVSCTASDGWGKSATGSFNVTVVLEDEDEDEDENGNGNGEPEPDLPDTSAFDRVWERTDLPVANGRVSRTWIWGPEPFASPFFEEYAESPDGLRAVSYLDKSRMEMNNPSADQSSIWYVTNGLLVVELISGMMQVGDAEFEPGLPADVPVAGDLNDPTSPTYASFTDLAFPAYSVLSRVGETATERVDRDGNVDDDPDLEDRGVTIAYFDSETGHNIAAPFWEFMNSSGLVSIDGELVEDRIFPNEFYGTGRPITEPYWATVLVGGVPHDVLMQCFERRCLTYTPDNPDGWQVEAGNVGLHYYWWRYGEWR